MHPSEIAAKEFPTGVFGYEKDDVRDYLRDVARLLEQRDRQIRALEGVRARAAEAVTVLSRADAAAGPTLAPERGEVIAEERASPADPR